MLSWKLEEGNPPTYTAGGKFSVRVLDAETWDSYFGKILLGRSSSVIDAVDVCERIHAHKSFERAIIEADNRPG